MGVITYPGLTSKELFKIMTEDDDMPWVKYLKENAKAYPYQNEPMTKSAFYLEVQENDIMPVSQLNGDIKARKVGHLYEVSGSRSLHELNEFLKDLQIQLQNNYNNYVMVLDGRDVSQQEGNENEVVEEHTVRYLSLAQTSSSSSSNQSTAKIESFAQQATSNSTDVIKIQYISEMWSPFTVTLFFLFLFWLSFCIFGFGFLSAL